MQKLVRDKIINIIKNSGKTPIYHVASEEDMDELLKDKLKEEVEEFLESGEVEELVDILEVIRTISFNKGVNPDDLETIRKEKVNKRGGFERKIVLHLND